jgi:hypothetical protein
VCRDRNLGIFLKNKCGNCKGGKSIQENKSLWEGDGSEKPGEIFVHEEMQNENHRTKLSKMYRRGRGILQRETLDGVERFILERDIVSTERMLQGKLLGVCVVPGVTARQVL